MLQPYLLMLCGTATLAHARSPYMQKVTVVGGCVSKKEKKSCSYNGILIYFL